MADDDTGQELQRWILPLLRLCQEAGAAICEHYYAPQAGDFVAKDDDSPLTRADLESHALLCAGLALLDPAIPVLSEESDPVDFSQRRQWHRYWLVDPLDGTREFLARTGDFTINIALIDHHRPVLGVLYQPLERLAYVGIPGLQADCYRESGGGGDWVPSPLATRRLQDGQPLVVMASRRHRGVRLQRCLDWLGENWRSMSLVQAGGALKFCHLAAGLGDLYPRFSPCCEWDTAAGQAVLEGAGGCLLGLDGEPLRYNCQDSLYSPAFYAIADGSHSLWQALLDARMG
jgi:3'(2'), 5'-bisphosphate nucleotidase